MGARDAQQRRGEAVPLRPRHHGVLQWHAMLRLLEAGQRNGGFPPYWS